MTGKYYAERGGEYPGVRNVIQGGGPGGAAVHIGVMGHVGSDEEYGGGYTHRVPTTDHGEEGAAKPRKYICDTSGG